MRRPASASSGPKTPFHGRRCPSGYYGGERLIGSFPLGALDAFAGAVREMGSLGELGPRHLDRPPRHGRHQLGALTAQLVADRSRTAGDVNPEGLLLITRSGDMRQTILDGELTRLFDSTDAAIAKGWTEELIDAYFGLLDPKRGPASLTGTDR